MQIKDILEILKPVLFGIILAPILWKQISFPIIMNQTVGSDSQCLSPPRQSLQNLMVHYKIVSLKVKILIVFKIFVTFLLQNRLTLLKM